MPIFPEAPIRLQVTGSVRHVPLAGMASLAVDADGVLVAPLDGELQAASVVRIGFDGIEFADFAEPTLTTFRQPLREIGRTGAQALLKMIQGEAGQVDLNVRLPLNLLERGTTGPAPEETRG